MSMFPVLLLFSPVIVSIIMYLVKKPWIHFLVFPLQAFLAYCLIAYIMALQSSPELALTIFGGWRQDIAISFYVDYLNLTFMGLTIFFFLIIYYYSFKANYREKKFFFFLTFLQGIVLGLLMTNDLFNLFVFLELISLLVTLLITYKKVEHALKAGLQYLLLSSVAAMFYLIGVLLLYYVFGTINIRLILIGLPEVIDSTVIKLAYVMMLTGFALKGAIFPLYAWLPKAHGVAQSSISALLSGLIVKLALYLILRIHGQMFAVPYGFDQILFYLGFISSLVGVIFAMAQKDIKQILAYHTISQVGLMLIGLSFASGTSFVGGLFHVVNHAIFKGLLFLSAGVIIKVYQTKKVNDIRGLFKTLPWTSILLIIAILSITGAPLFNGFVSKTMIKYAFKDQLGWYALFTLINLGTIVSFSKLIMMFFGKPLTPVNISRASITQHIPMSILALSSLAIGIFYQPILTSIYQFIPYDVHIFDPAVYLDYLFYALIGFNIYLFIIKKDYRPLKWLRHFYILFPTANYLMVVLLMSFIAIIFLF